LNEYYLSINAIFDLFLFSFISIVKIKVKLLVTRTKRDKIQSRGEFFGNNVFLELFFKVGAKISEFRKIRPRTRKTRQDRLRQASSKKARTDPNWSDSYMKKQTWKQVFSSKSRQIAEQVFSGPNFSLES
jgi:hypothetical protein